MLQKPVRLHPHRFVRRMVCSGRGAKREFDLLQRYLHKFWERLGMDGRHAIRSAALTTARYLEQGLDDMAGVPSSSQ